MSVIQRNLGLTSKVNLVWNGPRIEAQLYARLARNLRIATKFYHGEVTRIFKTQPWGSKAIGGGLRRKAFKSSPTKGPPYKQTGNLANSPVWSVRVGTRNAFFTGGRMKGRNSTEVKYAKNLELGGATVRIPQSQKIHTAVRLVNPIPKRKTPVSISPRPVWIPLLERLTPKLLKILAK